ncbi:MAG: hypothetical protein LBL51_00990 [Synergistaceae bacterium]|jgi:hypothetical protein|nr:hypothetical protein [Synergistaceae bacterium]
MALINAVCIVLIGSLLAGILFSIGAEFSANTTRQREFYANHLTVTDHIQRIKGWILKTNITNEKAMHAGSYGGDTTATVASLNDLMFTRDELSYDVTLAGGRYGRQRLTANVYDVYYYPSQLGTALTSDPAAMRELPAPINGTRRSAYFPGQTAAKPVSDMEREGESTTADKGKNDDDTTTGHLLPSTFGAYVIRVKLFDIDRDGSEHFVRSAEEAFFQVISPDLAP